MVCFVKLALLLLPFFFADLLPLSPNSVATDVAGRGIDIPNVTHVSRFKKKCKRSYRLVAPALFSSFFLFVDLGYQLRYADSFHRELQSSDRSYRSRWKGRVGNIFYYRGRRRNHGCTEILLGKYGQSCSRASGQTPCRFCGRS